MIVRVAKCEMLIQNVTENTNCLTNIYATESDLTAGLKIIGYAVATKTLRFRLILERWAGYEGTSKAKRIAWTFVGGMILIFGAQMHNVALLSRGYGRRTKGYNFLQPVKSFFR